MSEENDKAAKAFPNTNFSNFGELPQVTRQQQNSDSARWEPVELIDEKMYPTDQPRLITVKAGEIGLTIADRLRMAHTNGKLKASLDHWIGTLDGLKLIDKTTRQTLMNLRSEITGYFNKDKPVMEKLEEVFWGLRPRKR